MKFCELVEKLIIEEKFEINGDSLDFNLDDLNNLDIGRILNYKGAGPKRKHLKELGWSPNTNKDGFEILMQIPMYLNDDNVKTLNDFGFNSSNTKPKFAKTIQDNNISIKDTIGKDASDQVLYILREALFGSEFKLFDFLFNLIGDVAKNKYLFEPLNVYDNRYDPKSSFFKEMKSTSEGKKEKIAERIKMLFEKGVIDQDSINSVLGGSGGSAKFRIFGEILGSLRK